MKSTCYIYIFFIEENIVAAAAVQLKLYENKFSFLRVIF
jgi:hypothetical protein